MKLISKRLEALEQRIWQHQPPRIFVRAIDDDTKRWHLNGKPTDQAPGAHDVAIEIVYVDHMGDL